MQQIDSSGGTVRFFLDSTSNFTFLLFFFAHVNRSGQDGAEPNEAAAWQRPIAGQEIQTGHGARQSAAGGGVQPTHRHHDGRPVPGAGRPPPTIQRWTIFLEIPPVFTIFYTTSLEHSPGFHGPPHVFVSFVNLLWIPPNLRDFPGFV